VEAVRKGLENGIIDVVVSDHGPQDIECKDLEFDLADNGIVALQTAFASANTALKGENESLIEALTTNPYKNFRIRITKNRRRRKSESYSLHHQR
jgi:dihydroorotase